MRTATFVTALALLPFTAGALRAQDQPAGYHNVACIKVENGQWEEYLRFVREHTSKVMRARIEAGQIASWNLLRTAMPSGSEARCDFVSVTVFPGLPPAPAGTAGMDAALRKAGVPMTGQEYRARRDKLTRLVSQEMWRTAIRTGEMRKGDYAYVNFMKVHNMAEWAELERTVWKPLAERWIEQGDMRGWLMARRVLPSGTDVAYQALTLDVFPSWEKMIEPRRIDQIFARVHPDKDRELIFQRLGKSRDLARRELLVVEELVEGSGAAAMTGSR